MVDYGTKIRKKMNILLFLVTINKKNKLGQIINNTRSTMSLGSSKNFHALGGAAWLANE